MKQTQTNKIQGLRDCFVLPSRMNYHDQVQAVFHNILQHHETELHIIGSQLRSRKQTMKIVVKQTK